jgi:hypothetical protein
LVGLEGFCAKSFVCAVIRMMNRNQEVAVFIEMSWNKKHVPGRCYMFFSVSDIERLDYNPEKVLVLYTCGREPVFFNKDHFHSPVDVAVIEKEEGKVTYDSVSPVKVAELYWLLRDLRLGLPLKVESSS